MENNFEKILREALRRDAIEISSTIAEYVGTDADQLLLSKEDTQAIIFTAKRLNHLLTGCTNYVDAVGEKITFNLSNIILAIQDKTITEIEKIEMINTLVCNWVDNLPDEWSEKFRQKYETEKRELDQGTGIVID